MRHGLQHERRQLREELLVANGCEGPRKTHTVEALVKCLLESGQPKIVPASVSRDDEGPLHELWDICKKLLSRKDARFRAAEPSLLLCAYQNIRVTYQSFVFLFRRLLFRICSLGIGVNSASLNLRFAATSTPPTAVACVCRDKNCRPWAHEGPTFNFPIASQGYERSRKCVTA